MNKTIPIWIKIGLPVIVLSVASGLAAWKYNSAKSVSGNPIAQKAYAALADKDNTIERVKIIMQDSTLETWHDPATGYSRSESKDLQGNIQNITIVKGDTVVHLAPAEKKASITHLSPRIVKMNEYLYYSKQFDLIKVDLNSADWTRLPDATIHGTKTYVIEHLAKGTIDSRVVMRLYLDQNSLMPIRDELYSEDHKKLLNSDDREYKLVSSAEEPSLFDTTIPQGYSVTETYSNDIVTSNEWANYNSSIYPISFSVPPKSAVIIENNGSPAQFIEVRGQAINDTYWPWIEIQALMFTPSKNLRQWVENQFTNAYSKVKDTKVAGLPAVHGVHDRSEQSYGSEDYYMVYKGKLYKITFLNSTGKDSDWMLYNKFLESIKFQ